MAKARVSANTKV